MLRNELPLKRCKTNLRQVLKGSMSAVCYTGDFPQSHADTDRSEGNQALPASMCTPQIDRTSEQS